MPAVDDSGRSEWGVDSLASDPSLDQLVASADRFDGFADTAELMGDEAGAVRFRSEAAARRAAAMTLLDD